MTEPFETIADTRPDDTAWAPLAWPPAADTVLEGTTIRLVPLVPERDAAELFAVLDHDAVWTHVAGRPATAAEYAASLIATTAAGRFAWAVQLVEPLGGHAAGALVGTTSYLDISIPDSRLEIGFTTYTPACWATAVNPEAKLLLLGFAFDTLGAGRVQLKTDARNLRSQRAIARLGASHEGTLRRYQRRADGTIRDTVMFSIIAEQWPGVRAALRERLGTAETLRVRE